MIIDHMDEDPIVSLSDRVRRLETLSQLGYTAITDGALLIGPKASPQATLGRQPDGSFAVAVRFDGSLQTVSSLFAAARSATQQVQSNLNATNSRMSTVEGRLDAKGGIESRFDLTWQLAQQGVNAAASAQSTANDAWNKAAAAQSSASSAQSTANDAWSKASQASSVADSAYLGFSSVTTKINQLETRVFNLEHGTRA